MTTHNLYGALALSARGLSRALEYWGLIGIGLLLASPVGPHLRWDYSYREIGGQRYYVSCSYIGSRGVIVSDSSAGNCPLILLIDTRSGGR